MKRHRIVSGILAASLFTVPVEHSRAADFTVPNGVTDNTPKTLTTGETGAVEQGGTLSIGGGDTAIEITGSGTVNIINDGIIRQTTDERAIDNSGGGNSGTRIITNNLNALIESADADTIRINRSDSNVTINNHGIIRSLNASAGGAQALDFNAITSGTNLVNNWGLIEATAADAIRPGEDGRIYNWGTISAIPIVEIEDSLNVVSGSDGIDAQDRTGSQIYNWGTVSGRHGITGEDGGDGFTITITNYQNGTITGVNGSGINIDESTATATVYNYGSIIGNYDSATYDVGDGDGVDVDGIVHIENFGAIRGINAGGLNDGSLNNAEGVSVGGGVIINHAGAEITGENHAATESVGNGILVDNSEGGAAFAATTVINSGLIHGKTGFGIKIIGDFADSITNNAGGIIRGGGDVAALQTGGGNDAVINRGRIIGDLNKAIDLGGGDDSLTLLGSSPAIVGNVVGGAGFDVLTVNISGTFHYAGSFTEFESALFQNGRTNLSGSSVFSNGVTVSGGSLAVNGSVQTPLLQVLGGGVLMGNGIVIGNVLNSGTVAPGNSIGLLTIAGNYTQTRSGTLQIEAASASNHDVLVVTGTARLDGTLEIIALGDDLEFGDRIPFLRAGNIVGSFDEIIAPRGQAQRGRFLNLGKVGVLLVAPASYTLVAETPNQKRVAGALDQWIGIETGDKGVVTLALDLLREDQYPQAFEAIMPKFHEGALSTGIELSHSQGQMLHQYLSARRLGARANQVPPHDPGMDSGKGVVSAKSGKSAKDTAPEVPPLPEDYRVSTWLMGSGLFSSGGLSLNSGEDFESGAFLAGADYAISESFSLGLFAGYGEGWGDYANGGQIDLERITFGGYATLDIGGFYLNAAVGGGTVDYDIKRPIQFATLNRSAKSDPDGTEFFALLGGGYDIQNGNWTFGPQASLQYSKVSLDSFTEHGADSLNLRLHDPDMDSLRSYLGGRVAYTIQATDRVAIIPEVRAFWQHEFLDGDGFRGGLDGGAGPAFNYEPERDEKDSLFIGAGIGLQVGARFYANLYYNVDVGREEPSHHVSISATIRF